MRLIHAPATALVVTLVDAVEQKQRPKAASEKSTRVARASSATGAVFAFRGRRGDRIKLSYWDGQGFCLFHKVLERGRLPQPSAADGTARFQWI